MNKEIYQDPGLTIRPQTLYSGKEGLIFNMEGETGEVPKLPQVPPKTTPPITPQGKFHTPEEKVQIAKIGEALEGITGAPPEEFQRSVEENLPPEEKEKRAKIVGERKREKTSDFEPTLQLDQEEQEEPRFSTEGISNADLLTEIARLNAMPPGQFLYRGTLDISIQKIENLIRLGAPEDQARRIIDRLLDWRMEVMGMEEEATRMAGEEARGAQRGTPRAYFNNEEINRIKNNPEERERIFENLFARADATPGREFHDAFSPYYDEPLYRAFIDTLREGEREQPGRRGEFKALITRYVTERELREVLHNTNYVLVAQAPSDTLVKHLQQFRSEMADLAFSKKGVVTALHMYELALLTVMEENNGWLPYEEVAWDSKSGVGTGRTEELAREYFKRALEGGAVRDPQGQAIKAEEIQDWEIERAFTLARGMGIITLKTLEIAASSKLPPGRLASLYAQDIIRDLNPFTHLIGKFGIGLDQLAVLAFLTNRGVAPWSQRELLEFIEFAEEKGKENENMLAILEGKLGERLLMLTNPLRGGGLLGGWRSEPMTKHLESEEQEWAGGWVRLGSARGDKAKQEEIFQRLVETQPLGVYLNLPKIQAAIKEEILKDIPEERRKAVFNQLKQDMVFLQEKLFATVQGKLLQIRQKREQGEQTEGIPFIPKKGQPGEQLDVDLLPEAEGRRGLAKAFTEIIQQRFTGEKGKEARESFLKEFNLKRQPSYADVPMDKLRFIVTGGTGIPRKLRDFGCQARTVGGIIETVTKMASYQKPEEIIEDLHSKIFKEISGYDAEFAQEFVCNLAEGIIKFYSKDWWARLPFGAGAVLGFAGDRGWLRGRKSSYARTQFGNMAMKWDETDKWKFTRELLGRGIINKKQLKELQGKVGATTWHMIYDQARIFVPLGFWILISDLLKVLTQNLTKELTTT